MRVLHTSDWHLGRLLYGQKRHHEFAAFLDWLHQCVIDQGIDILLVAGDIFDTNTPGNQAQQLYYRFLARLSLTECRHVVVIGGNHDSPSFLDAPGSLLKALNVHVIGEACADPRDAVLALEYQGQLEAIVCAVPYLRERDLRRVSDGESAADKDTKLIAGVREHYQAAADYAQSLRGAAEVPIIGMGHLFITGGQLQEGDGVRELYVGSLGQVPLAMLPSFDYLALEHLHMPQKVGGVEHIRYSGSPVAMGFGEVGQQKVVLQIEFHGRVPSITALEIPVFQTKARVRGDLAELKVQLSALIAEQKSVWVEVEYTGDASVNELRHQLAEMVEGSEVAILRVRNKQRREQALSRTLSETSLAELSPAEVFQRRLALEQMDETRQARMTELHQQVLQAMQEADTHADS